MGNDTTNKIPQKQLLTDAGECNNHAPVNV